MPVTDQQLEQGIKALWEAWLDARLTIITWDHVSPSLKTTYLTALRVAFPYLQQSIAEATEDEAFEAIAATQMLPSALGYVSDAQAIINHIIRKRNEALTPKPKPIDVRREKVLALFATRLTTTDEIVDKIIAAMDEENAIAGRISLNEYRARIGMEPVPEAK